MPRDPKGETPAEVIGAAVMVGRIATGEIEEGAGTPPDDGKDTAADGLEKTEKAEHSVDEARTPGCIARDLCRLQVRWTIPAIDGRPVHACGFLSPKTLDHRLACCAVGGAIFGNQFQSRRFVGTGSDALPVSVHDPLMANFLDGIFCHYGPTTVKPPADRHLGLTCLTVLLTDNTSSLSVASFIDRARV
jgi:hypothetical protein